MLKQYGFKIIRPIFNIYTAGENIYQLNNKINQLSKININNLIMLDDNSQYESTVEEIQTTRLLSKDTFCKNIHPDDIDKMFDKGHILLEMRLDDSTLVGYSVFDLKMKEKHKQLLQFDQNTAKKPLKPSSA